MTRASVIFLGEETYQGGVANDILPLGTVPLLHRLPGERQEQSTLSGGSQWNKIYYLGLQYLIICRSKMLSHNF